MGKDYKERKLKQKNDWNASLHVTTTKHFTTCGGI